VSAEEAEVARAAMLDLFPEGFEEAERGRWLELAAYGRDEQESAVRARFGACVATEVEPGWEERWRAFHHGVRIGPLWVGPPWEEPADDAAAVVIDPGRAFGTGAHPTTRLCLELLGRVPRGSLVDAGCGSGVIAIAAAKLGFSPVAALDDDPAAVEATLRNAAANGVVLEARLVDVLAEHVEADVVVANVSLEVVRAVAPRVDALWLVSSGYLVGDAVSPEGWKHEQRAELEGWAADLWHRERQ
jgi:ribosomal protein L11 methyltransferase